MTFEKWFRETRGVHPNLDPNDYDNDLGFKAAYEAGYRQRDVEIMELYKKAIEKVDGDNTDA